MVLEPATTSLLPSSILTRLYRHRRVSIGFTSIARKPEKEFSSTPRLAFTSLDSHIQLSGGSTSLNGSCEKVNPDGETGRQTNLHKEKQTDRRTDEETLVLCIVSKARFSRSTWEAYLRQSLCTAAR